jgi:Family of unknown function (DUF5681)
MDEVGYAKPPVDARFKPGQSGNPKGRPRGSVNVAIAFERALKEKVAVNEDGQRKLITKLDAAVKQLVNKAAMGDPRAMQLLVKITKVGSARAESVPEAGEVLDEADQQVMEGVLERMRQYIKGEDDEPLDQ